MGATSTPIAVGTIVGVAVLLTLAVLVVRRAGVGARGDRREVVVRCRDGHVFRTVWIPGVSVKAIRLGGVRFQYCPVGRHRTFVTPVPPGQLTDRERRMAAYYDDGGLP
jgi:hypothetical protein